MGVGVRSGGGLGCLGMMFDGCMGELGVGGGPGRRVGGSRSFTEFAKDVFVRYFLGGVGVGWSGGGVGVGWEFGGWSGVV